MDESLRRLRYLQPETGTYTSPVPQHNETPGFFCWDVFRLSKENTDGSDLCKWTFFSIRDRFKVR